MQDTLAAILERMAAFVYVLKNKICGTGDVFVGAKLPELKEVREAKDKLVRWLSGDEVGIGSWQDKLAVF